jgi:hypothetical protein
MKEALLKVLFSENKLSVFDCLLSYLLVFDFFLGSDETFIDIDELDFSIAKCTRDCFFCFGTVFFTFNASFSFI